MTNPMRDLFVRWLINTLALYLAIQLVPGFDFEGGPGALLMVAALFGVVNSLLRPLLTLLTCPLVLLTLGLFTLVINALLLLCTAWLSSQFHLGLRIAGFWPAFWAGLLVGIVSVVLSLATGTGRVEVHTHRE